MLENDLTFRGTRIEDLCLEFSIPGYPQICLASGPNREMVNMSNLEDYVSLVTDVTGGSGISGQVEAFKSGFNQVLPIKHLRIFSEEELELILCGEQDSWTFNEPAEHIEFDCGYDARSPPIVNLLEILQEFDHEQQRTFLQFLTGSPRLPPGGLASLCPKLTVIEMVLPIKHLRIFSEEELELILCGEQDSWTFNELAEHIEFDYGYDARSPPIVNLLEILQEFDHEQRRAFLQFVTGSPRLPPGGLASLCPKLTVIEMETMKEKLLYAITEGQGSFQLP